MQNALSLPHKLVKHPERNISDETGQLRFGGRNVDRRADKNQPSHLFWKTRGIDQCHPAALAKANQGDRRSEFVYRNIEVGKVVVDGKITCLRGCRPPIGDKYARQATLAQRLAYAMTRSKIRNGCTV